LIIVLSATLWAGAAPTPTPQAPQPAPFGAVFLHTCVPPALPAPVLKGLEKHLENVEYAVIPTGKPGFYVAFYRGEPVGDQHFASKWIWHRQPSGLGILSSVPFKKGSDGMLTVNLKLSVDVTNTAAAPLELQFLPQHHLLLYRWSGASQGQIGGTLTVDQYHRETRMGEPVPDFTAARLNGGLVSLGGLRGHVLVLNSWATSCTPCVEEIPGLNKLVDKFSKRGVVFLALANNSKQQLRDFLPSHPFEYQQALLGEHGMEIFGNAFPRNLIVDPHGTVVYDFTGGSPKTASRLEPVIEKLLAKGK